MPVLTAVLTCPLCGAQSIEAVPEDACLRYYQCTSCGHTLTPRGRDCCVFCSYANTRCPPMARNTHLALPGVS